MNTKFMHVGKYCVKPELRDEFVKAIMEFERSISNHIGLNLSYLLDSENEPNTFWYITIWSSKEFWERAAKLDNHKRLSEKCDAYLSQPANNNFGSVLF